ncbi:MAG: cysteine hydrolase [Leptospiraceae bacterium]|nr:cysteine hydrolase [Leptospiraceae bacterium]
MDDEKSLLEDLDPRYIDIDPLRETYREAITEYENRFKPPVAVYTALMLIDMQYLDAARGYGLFSHPEQSGVPLEAQEYYFRSLEEIVIPNMQRLLTAFRARNIEVIHTRIQSLTKNGRDRSPGHKRLNVHAAPGSKEAEFLPEVAPLDDEIIINKTASGVFTATNLNYVLTNMQIKHLYMTGVYTNECVSTAVRDASDLGYFVTLISDACTTVTHELQQSTLFTLRDRYARVISTHEALREIDEVFKHPDAAVELKNYENLRSGNNNGQ